MADPKDPKKPADEETLIGAVVKLMNDLAAKMIDAADAEFRDRQRLVEAAQEIQFREAVQLPGDALNVEVIFLKRDYKAAQDMNWEATRAGLVITCDERRKKFIDAGAPRYVVVVPWNAIAGFYMTPTGVGA